MLAETLGWLESILLPAGWSGVRIAEDIDVLADLAGQVDDRTVIIMPWRERAHPPALLGLIDQMVEVQIAVGVVIREYDHLMGGDRAVRLDLMKAEVEAALCGWTPPSAEEPYRLVGGESSPISKGVSIYVQTWETARYLRQPV